MEGDPNFILGDVRGIEMGSDGAIYVLDFQAAELRAFEPDGSFRHMVAREGDPNPGALPAQNPRRASPYPGGGRAGRTLGGAGGGAGSGSVGYLV